MNNKGFALTETLVVVVFLVSIFTFIYISIIPLIGKYENKINNDTDIDMVYKLYHVRKVLMSGGYKTDLTTGSVKKITCSDFYKENEGDFRDLCNKLMEQMELRNNNTDNYVLIYAGSLSTANINSITSLSGEIGEYAKNYQNKLTGRLLFLLDTNKHTVSHLNYDDTI